MTVAIMSNVVFIAILAFSIYGIGIDLWNRSTGLLSAIFVLSLPMFVSQFKEYQLDVELSAMVAWSLYALIRTRHFTDYRKSMIFGLIFGLGMLTKWTFIHCMMLPLAHEIWIARGVKGPVRSTILWNVFRSALIAFCVTLLWYGNHPRMLINDLSGNSSITLVGPWYSIPNLLCYPVMFETIQTYLCPTALFVLGLVIGFSRRHKANRLPLLLIIGNYVFLLPSHRDVRYIMPMMVGVSIISVYWVSLIKTPWLKSLARTGIVSYCVLSFWVMSFGFSFLPQEISWGPVKVFAQSVYTTASPPTHEQWHQEELFQVISRFPEKERNLRTDCLDTMFFNGWGFTYYALKYGVSLLKTENENASFVAQRKDFIGPAPAGYSLVARYDLPDKSILILYRLIPLRGTTPSSFCTSQKRL